MSLSVSLTPVGLRPDLALAVEEIDLQADREGFVGLRIAPAREVMDQAHTYPVASLADRLRTSQTLRNSDGTYTGSTLSRNTRPYATEDHGHEVLVDDRSSKIYQHVLNADIEATEVARDVVLRSHEARVIAAANAISNVTDVTASSGVPWTTPATSKPIADVKAARIKVRNRGGGVPNVLVVDFEVFENLRDNAEILDRVKYDGKIDPAKDEITASAIASALGLEELIVANAMINTANENQAAVLATMWPKAKALLFTRRTSGTTKKTQFMRTLHWGQDGSRIGGAFEKYRNEAKRGYVVRARMETTEEVVYEDSGEILNNVAA